MNDNQQQIISKLLIKNIYIDNNKQVNPENNEEFKHLICGICKEVALEAQECQQCQNIFCKQCISHWMVYSQCCPFNCNNIQIKSAHRLVKQAISNLKFACAYASNGCKEVLLTEQMLKHLDCCQYIDYQCPNQGCQFQGTKIDASTHELQCNFAIIECQYCQGSIFRYNQIDKKHNCISKLSMDINKMEKQLEQAIPQQEIQKNVTNLQQNQDFIVYQNKTLDKLEVFNKKIDDILKVSINNNSQDQYHVKQQVQNVFQQPYIQQNQVKISSSLGLRDYCRKNHPLCYKNNTGIQNIFRKCDVCGEKVYQSKANTYYCQQCDFDRCEKCYRDYKI